MPFDENECYECGVDVDTNGGRNCLLCGELFCNTCIGAHEAICEDGDPARFYDA